jgi:hypothetical protein
VGAVAVGRKSRDKGYAGEVEAAHLFEEFGSKVQRLQRNRNDAADLLIDHWLYVDVKRGERAKYAEWKAQVVGVTPDGATPAIMHRVNHGDWWIWLPALDFAERMP